MEHILSLSYGKDSIACLGAIEELGLPLDRIVHVEVWATDTIHADFPEMVEFKEKADAIIKGRYGIEVEHISSEVSYEEQFYKRRFNKKKEIDCIYGFPCVRGAWCNDRLKTGLLKKINKGNICYIGIASDEPNRFHNLTDEKISPLVEAGWTEDMCRKWCEENNFFHSIPFYGLTEVVNDNNDYCQAGETGEMVGTSFWMQGTFFIRYKTGDRASVEGNTECNEDRGSQRKRFVLGGAGRKTYIWNMHAYIEVWESGGSYFPQCII